MITKLTFVWKIKTIRNKELLIYNEYFTSNKSLSFVSSFAGSKKKNEEMGVITQLAYS